MDIALTATIENEPRQTKKVINIVKLLLPGGEATAAPPVGPVLNNYGINIPVFLNEFNAKTKRSVGKHVPTIITIYADHSFSFVVKTPPAPIHIKPAPIHIKPALPIDITKK